MTYPEFETFLSEANDYLKARIERSKAQFGIMDLPRYDYDLRRGEIWWGDIGAPQIRGRVTVVGTISTKSNTWLWSWANPHFSDVKLGDIDKVREFGEREAIAKLTEEKWEAEEVDGWEMTAISARLLEAEGAYRPPDENGFLFLLFDRLERIPAGERERYSPRKVDDKTWPFADPENVAVFTLADISKRQAPILRVCHDDDDGAWQFLTGGPLPEKTEWVLLALKEVVRIDPTIAELAGLPLGWEASRTVVGRKWTTKPEPK